MTAWQRVATTLCLLLALEAPHAASGSATDEDRVQLTREVLGQIQKAPYSKAQWGILAFDLAAGEVLFAHNASQTFIPASNRKLFTTAFALDTLGSSYQFQTAIYRSGQVNAGVLSGDLVVKATGDPSLTTDSFDNLASQVAAGGIRSVTGRLIIDTSAFASLTSRGEGWSKDYQSHYYAAPVSPLAVNQNTVNVNVGPGSTGSACKISISPSANCLRLINSTSTVSSGASTIDVVHGSDGQSLVVRGRLSRKAGTEINKTSVPNPTQYAAEVLLKALARNGVSVAAGTTVSTVPVVGSGAVMVASHTSPDLGDLLEDVNQDSNNFTAEMIYIAAGRAGTTQPGSYALSRQQERAFWLRSGLSDAALMYSADGCGLSRSNLVTPRALCEVLRYMLVHHERDTFTRSLAVNGKVGTLKSRLDEPLYRNRVVGKTGYISSVSCLSGYVIDRENQTQIFSIMANGFDCSTSSIKSVQDRICRWLIDLPQKPEALAAGN